MASDIAILIYEKEKDFSRAGEGETIECFAVCMCAGIEIRLPMGQKKGHCRSLVWRHHTPVT